MNPRDPLEILRRHNQWRRGADIEMLSPSAVGECIDQVILEVERLRVVEELAKNLLCKIAPAKGARAGRRKKIKEVMHEKN